MIRAFPDFSAPPWTTDLVRALVEASTAIARLDERISANPLTSSWQLRASWSGYAAAITAEGGGFEEIDIFGQQCGVPLPFRAAMPTTAEPLEYLAGWQARLRDGRNHHWIEGLNFSFDPVADWADRPALLRALELQAHQVRVTAGVTPWLELPILLQRLGVTRIPFACLVAPDKRLRIAPNDRGIIPRYLRALTTRARDGMAVLDAMEADRRRFAAGIADVTRPGHLTTLGALLMQNPVISPTRAALLLKIGISGASKLLKRAAALDLIVEVSDRHNWQIYMSRDLAIRFGFRASPLGRPPSPPPPSPALDDALRRFDAELEAFDARIRLVTGAADLG
jgi:hypothetical protein